MIVIGLTGSIAMGKTTVAKQFAALGVPTLDSDRVVHRLLAQDKPVIAKICSRFPAACTKEGIDRARLAKTVFSHPQKLKELEAILHPEVQRVQAAFIRQMRARGKRMVLLDIPLLFETKGEQRCDYTVVVSAPAFLQRQRALRRPQMTLDRFESVLARQMPDAEKRKRADFVVLTGIGKKASLQQVRRIVNLLRQSHARNHG